MPETSAEPKINPIQETELVGNAPIFAATGALVTRSDETFAITFYLDKNVAGVAESGLKVAKLILPSAAVAVLVDTLGDELQAMFDSWDKVIAEPDVDSNSQNQSTVS